MHHASLGAQDLHRAIREPEWATRWGHDMGIVALVVISGDRNSLVAERFSKRNARAVVSVVRKRRLTVIVRSEGWSQGASS